MDGNICCPFSRPRRGPSQSETISIKSCGQVSDKVQKPKRAPRVLNVEECVVPALLGRDRPAGSITVDEHMIAATPTRNGVTPGIVIRIFYCRHLPLECGTASP